MPITGHHHRLLLQQHQQQWVGDDDGLDALLQAQEHLVATQQQQQRLEAAAAAAESQEPAFDLMQEDDWATAELESLAAMQQSAAVAAMAAAAGSNGSSVAVPASIHRILSVIKPDDRLPCPAKTYPYYAMGQIKAKASDGGFVCSGGLIGSNRVLTAGHCVWDDRNAQGPFKDLRFAPGQWKVSGKTESPFGFVDWDYVTLFDTYINDPDGEGLPFDVAVITLTKPVGTELGWLGIRAAAPPCKSTPLTLTLAGYPGEDPEHPIVGGWAGGCWYDKCDVAYSCSVSITNHTCDSFVGQSGAPMFDQENYVRAVHTLGVLPGFSTTNGAITIQKFLLDNLMGYWRDTDGYTQAKSPAQAKRGKKLFQ
jgi:V8-like Glu-specific endopeptidase